MPDKHYIQSRIAYLLNGHTLVYGAQYSNSYVKPSGGSGVWEGPLKMVYLSKCQKATMHLDNEGKTSGTLMQKLDPQLGSSSTGTYEEHLYNLF